MLVELMRGRLSEGAILSEYYFNEEYQCSNLYHHSKKGCDIKVKRDRQFTLSDGRPIEYLYCKTHNCYCSKTGWEFHHYLGNNSLICD